MLHIQTFILDLFKRILNLYLYSSLHIGLGALSLVVTNYIAFDFTIDQNYILFAFTATTFLYCLHRIIGIRKIKDLENKGRFHVISSYWNHILIYAIISACLSMYFFLKFDWGRWIILLVPSVFSLLYALPLFGKGMRLRDFSYIKLFLIALVWTWITAFIPLWENQSNTFLIASIAIERFLFILAITIPFDIRDSQIDKDAGVATLIHRIGNNSAYNLSKVLLVVCLVILITIHIMGFLSNIYLLAFGLTYIISWLAIDFSKNKSHDYYYTGILDGTMILPGLILYIFNLLN